MIIAEILDNNEIIVNEQKNTHAIADSVLFETVSFMFPKSWDGYIKTVVFATKDKTINVILESGNSLCLSDTECFIPHEVLEYGEFELSVFGVKGESVATTTKHSINVLESGYVIGVSPSEPTISEYQQIIEITESAKSIAESVKNDAENGLFKGEKGDRGEKGEKGDKGDQGEKGDKGEPGIIENIDILFNPESENAQSGKAVADAIKDLQKSFADVEIIDDEVDATSKLIFQLVHTILQCYGIFKIKSGRIELEDEGGGVYFTKGTLVSPDGLDFNFFGSDMIKYKPINVGLPTSNNHAATKEYVDNAIGNALEGDY